MKHNHYASCRQPVYPNAADANYFTGKALQILTALASGIGVVTAMVFLVILA